MRFFLILAVVTGCAAAGPRSTQSKPTKQVSTFQIVYNQSQKVKAANNTLYIGSSKQDACCNQMNAEDAATFYLQDKELFLYSPGNPKQQVNVEYLECKTHVRYAIGSRINANKTINSGWRIDSDDNITFNGANLMTCGNSKLARDVLIYKSDHQKGADKACRTLKAKTYGELSPK
ncbi:cell wall protein [Fusarium austroafricanum]|uniref:Cell wall protein n=1 Tax=Fusarium austroafricanum TaxID=2364996 RepID=A0A8H4NUZ0_9HYPO|nr:cell wall protein [Fusarium austroafricanum]